MKISITAEHIAIAKPYPRSSPVALALIELGFTDVCLGRQYVFVDHRCFQLPAIAISNEIQFDNVFNYNQAILGDRIKGTVQEQIEPYEFEFEGLEPIVSSNAIATHEIE
jgi:hypothetical protein